MKKQKIISAGHVCLDITPEFNERKQKAIHELFLPGQLISMGKADVSIGGSVSNTGLMNDDVEQCNQQTKEIESSEKEIRKIFKDGQGILRRLSFPPSIKKE